MTKSAVGTIVPPVVPSGVARRKVPIIGGLAFLTVVYCCVFFLLQGSVCAQNCLFDPLIRFVSTVPVTLLL
jgi:hypothetical protein